MDNRGERGEGGGVAGYFPAALLGRKEYLLGRGMEEEGKVARKYLPLNGG